MKRFAFVTLALVGLLLLAAGFGGGWVWLSLGYVTIFAYGVDRLGPRALGNPEEGAEFPAAGVLSVALGLLHFVVLFAVVWSIGRVTFGLDAVGLFLAVALFAGQVGHPNAHELIHRSGRRERLLGKAVYSSILMGHHASAHPLVHHVHVGTEGDPVSAPLGRGFWRFLPRAWWGSISAGFAAESRRYAGRGMLAHPYVFYGVTSVGVLCLSAWLGGLSGVAVAIGVGVYAQLQICLSDYVQHYGLRRKMLENGKYEPVGPQHSWNTCHIFSSALMLNAPRHSDHHSHPNRMYPVLRLSESEMPMLPYSLPMMAVIALMPPLWRRVMDRRARAWSDV